MVKNFNLACDFFQFAGKNPDATCFVVAGETISYGALALEAGKVASHLGDAVVGGRVGILATRSIASYIGVLGALAAGSTYVPLNLKWPTNRIVTMLKTLNLDALIVDANGSKLLSDEVLAVAPDHIIVSDDAQSTEGAISFSQITATPLEEPLHRNGDDIAYIMHTSGSTGLPKGVIVTNASAQNYFDHAETWTNLTQQDRVGEAHDITFDLSVHNMFLAWRAGASQYILQSLDMLAPHAFIRKHEITAWMSVPTLVNTLRRAGRLSKGLLPSLRLSIFCGEPLPQTTVQAWADAAPNATIENIYGPTEGTVVCSRQRFEEPLLITPERGVMAIGKPLGDFSIYICNDKDEKLGDHQTGEIVIAGPQLAVGYLNDTEKTNKAFRMLDGERCYFTGDLGYRDSDGIFHHMGRTDNQIKMKGNRIELEEVDTHLRRVCETELACVVAWPFIDEVPQGMVGFTSSSRLDEAEIRRRMMQNLPEYMVPAKIVILDQMPLNVNDKIDRKALKASLESPGMETPLIERAGQLT